MQRYLTEPESAIFMGEQHFYLFKKVVFFVETIDHFADKSSAFVTSK